MAAPPSKEGSSYSAADRLHSVLEVLPVFLWTQSAPGVPCTGNRLWKETFAGEEGRREFSFLETIVREDRRVYEKLEEQAWQSQTLVDGDFRVPNAQGKIRWLRVRMKRLTFPGSKEPVLVGWAYDRTKEQEEQRDLSTKQKAAVETALFKTRFLANLSHELRTPINAILGTLSLLGDSALNDDQREQIQTIEKTTRNLLRLIEDILEFSQLESGTIKIEKTPFALIELWHNVEGLVADKAAEKELPLDLRIAPEVNQHLIGDPLRLGQILTNLLDNAIKFTDQGRILVMVTKAPVQGKGKVHLDFDIVDHGIGLAGDKQEIVFRAFHQADASLSRKYGGTGLGLAICRELTHLLGGTLGLFSEVGRGALFSLSVPLGEFTEASPAEVHPRVLVLSAVEERGHRLVRLIQGQGVEALFKPSWEEAREAFAAHPSLSSLVVDRSLLDSHLANFAERLRGYGFKEIPWTVVLTDHGPKRRSAKLREQNISGVMPDPFLPNELIQLLTGEKTAPIRSLPSLPQPDKSAVTDPGVSQPRSVKAILWKPAEVDSELVEAHCRTLFASVQVVSSRAEWNSALQVMHFDLALMVFPGNYAEALRMRRLLEKQKEAVAMPGVMVFGDDREWTEIEKMPLFTDGFQGLFTVTDPLDRFAERAQHWGLGEETSTWADSGTSAPVDEVSGESIRKADAWSGMNEDGRKLLSLLHAGDWPELVDQAGQLADQAKPNSPERQLWRKIQYSGGGGFTFAVEHWLRKLAQLDRT